MNLIKTLRTFALLGASASFALGNVASFAQDATTPEPIQAKRAAPASTFLPANTEVLLKMNQEVTTKGKTWDEGDTFKMSVVHDVMLGDFIVIPAGTEGVGKITWLTSKGAFGKSGKMDVELQYLMLNGQRVAIDGEYRQEGEGNTLATVGGVLLAGVFAGFVTGKSGRIPQGRELMATTETNLPVTLPAGATITPTTIQATVAVPVQSTVEAIPAPSQDVEMASGEVVQPLPADTDAE